MQITEWDGKFVTLRFKLMFGDSPYEGVGVLSFDSKRGVFQQVWRDSMMDGQILEEGTLPKESNVIELQGSWRPDPYCADGTKKRISKSNYTFNADDSISYQAWSKGDSQDEYFMDMEIKYVPAKATE